jgi:hypothetical protein
MLRQPLGMDLADICKDTAALPALFQVRLQPLPILVADFTNRRQCRELFKLVVA